MGLSTRTTSTSGQGAPQPFGKRLGLQQLGHNERNTQVLAVVENRQDVWMAQAQVKLDLALILALQRDIVAVNRRRHDNRDVSPQRGLIRRVRGCNAVSFSLLDDAIRADVRAGDKTHQRLRTGLGKQNTGQVQGHCGRRLLPCQRRVTPEVTPRRTCVPR